ncbi:MAG: MBL fold metallo-hydrolase [Candidatus Marinimicrobia bacterium]|nr:MBL fold metallo-hydrolase [Candidatus Neomarinimicrobiota bacterium]
MNNKVKVEFWGVRGSVPSPGPETIKYGGNTSCVSISYKDKILICDAGTGIRDLGSSLVQDPNKEIYILLSHSHWDHIQGFPFFKPIYQPDRPVYMFPSLLKKNIVLSSLVEQMDGAHFPVTPDQVPSNFNFITHNPLAFLSKNGFDIELVFLNHPGSALGYKIKVNDITICYFTDNEIEPPYKKTIEFDQLVEKCNTADVLIHDAQYTKEDMPLKHGWGHSLIHQVTELGHEAKVKNIVYFHHDPERSDEQLDKLLDIEANWLKSKNSLSNPIFAQERLILEF